ncbi:response regulator [Phenylobacterium sp.]|uniref:response regulator n=1 Tax=Phenylobacterium sp. TaxID=1871053 RepID=UPI0025E98E73|nr:response regulator [Phenylobacterium sp.]
MSPNCDLPIHESDRQGQVLRLVLAGKFDHEIAEELAIPLAAVASTLAKLERVAATTKCFDLVVRLVNAQRTGQVQTPAVPTLGSERQPVRRLLLADDHEINHLTIRAMVEDRGIEVVPAFDGAEALAKFKDGGVDRVLMDIEMPGIDGLEAVRAIRMFEREQGAGRTPIAMFTAHSGPEIEQASSEAGADSYIVKPISLNQLYAFVGSKVAAG